MREICTDENISSATSQSGIGEKDIEDIQGVSELQNTTLETRAGQHGVCDVEGRSLASNSQHLNKNNQNEPDPIEIKTKFTTESVPSIVVQSGTKGMERTVRTQRSLSKQEGLEEENDLPATYEKSQSEVNGKPQLQSMGSSEEQLPTQNGTVHRSRKVKLLVRSQAVREETSPPPEPQPEPQKQEARRHKDWQPPLSRGNSREQQFDSNNPVDLHQFIVETLNRNHKDRMLLLKIENELINLANDSKRTMHKFAQMSSYQRMLVHRVAAYFNMEHNVDTSGVAVIVNTTKATRIPDSRFRDFVREDLLLPEEPRRSILKRDSSSFDETGSFKCGERLGGGDSRRSKSFEEREEEYEKARRRIFNRDHSFDADGDGIDDLTWESEDAVFTNCDLPNPNQRNPRLLKVESYESGDTLRANSLRPSVAKSHSFNGYEPQNQQSHVQPTRVLTKQDSGSSLSSRISPSSSGYKSQRSDATLSATPSPTATPNLHTQLSAQSTTSALSPEPETVVWAVSDLSSVPPGSVLIHPQSGQPYTNPDGSIYHYDPNNPPRVMPEGGNGNPQVTNTQQVSQSPAKHGLTLSPLRTGAHRHQGAVTSPGQESLFLPGQCNFQSFSLPWGTSPPGRLTINNGCEQVTNKVENGYETQYMPNPQQYSQPIEPQQIQFHPVYPPQPPPQHYPPQRVQDSMGGGDLSQYMVGLSIDGSRQPPPPPPPDTRHLMYWQPHHVQGQGGGGTVYYTTPGGGARYQPQVPPQAYLPPPPPQPHPPPEHTGNCYGGSYPPSECIPYTPSTVHMYYTPPYNSGQNNANPSNSAQPNGAYYGNVPNCGGPILAVQYPQPCPHPTSPHTPQGVCGQFAVYNGCYPTHYTQPTATLPVPAQLFRKPSLQVGVRCNSPLRAPYPSSPTVKDRSPDHDKLQPLPVYGFRVLQGDMRLLGNAGRLPFTLQPPPKAPHPRKHRSKLGGRPQEGYHAASKA